MSLITFWKVTNFQGTKSPHQIYISLESLMRDRNLLQVVQRAQNLALHESFPKPQMGSFGGTVFFFFLSHWPPASNFNKPSFINIKRVKFSKHGIVLVEESLNE